MWCSKYYVLFYLLSTEIVPTSHFVFPGSSMCLHCHSGRIGSGASVAWTKNGHFIPETGSPRITPFSNGTLCIANTQFSDGGNYTCHRSGLIQSWSLSVIGKTLHIYSIYFVHSTFSNMYNCFHIKVVSLWNPLPVALPRGEH